MATSPLDQAFLREVVLDTTAPVLSVDSDGTVVFANAGVGRVLGYARSDLVGGSIDRLIPAGGLDVQELLDSVMASESPHHESVRLRTASGDAEWFDATLAGTSYDGGTYLTLTVHDTTDTETAHGPDTEIDVETDGRGEAILARRSNSGTALASGTGPETQLSGGRTDTPGLTAATVQRLTLCVRELDQLDASADPSTIGDRVVETVADVGYEVASLRLFDADEGELATVARTEAASQLVAEKPTYRLEASTAGRAFRTGKRVSWANGGTTTASETTSELLSAGCHVPVGDTGVLTVATTERESIPEANRAAFEWLAVAIERGLRTRDDVGSPDGTNATGAQESIDGIVMDGPELIADIIAADSRSEIERRICRGVGTTDPYDRAWIGDLDPGRGRVAVAASVGVEEATLESLDGCQLEELADAYERAIESGDLVRCDRTAAFDGSVDTDEGTAAVVPLEAGGDVDGVLVIGATTDGAFGSKARRVLDALSSVTKLALDAQNTEAMVLSDRAIQLEFQVTDPNCLAVVISSTFECYCEIRGTVKNPRGEYVSYARLERPADEDIPGTIASFDGVNDCRIVSDYGDECLVEVIRPSSGAEVMVEYGATIVTADAEDGRGRLTLEAPHGVNVEELVEAYQLYNPQSELIKKREIDRPIQTPAEVRSEIEGELTDKQRAAISAAYFSGYYDWPRDSTAEEIADSIGIAASTLHQHLRYGHRKLVAHLVDG